MNVQTNIPLSTLTTMKIGGNANYVAEVASNDELKQVFHNSKKLGQPVYVIGGGSNLIARDEGYPGIVIRNKIMGITVIEDNPSVTTLLVGGGEVWDNLVQYAVDRNLQGIECMSGIPGTVGAAPVQNIGAYGQELADTFVSLEAYDTTTDTFVTLKWEDCNFAYRSSIFRTTAVGRYIITRVTLTLNKKRPEPPFYEALDQYLTLKQFDQNNVTVLTLRQAVLAVRSDKLPDPAVLPNAGSFFKNMVVETWKANDLQQKYPDMPTYPADNEHVKIPAGWLIETADLKGALLHGMRVHQGNAVVLINESAHSYADLAAARDEITTIVDEKFQLRLEQEPLEIPSAQPAA